MIQRFIEKTLAFGHRYGITPPEVKDHGPYKKSGPLKRLLYPGYEPYYYAIEDILEGETSGFMLIIKGEYTWIPGDCQTLMQSIAKFIVRSDDPVEYFEHCRVYHMEHLEWGNIECKRAGKYSATIEFKIHQHDEQSKKRRNTSMSPMLWSNDMH